MPGPDSCFDLRDLPAATLDSRSLLNALQRDLRERAPITVQNGLLAGVLFPPTYNAVSVFWIDFHAGSHTGSGARFPCRRRSQGTGPFRLRLPAGQLDLAGFEVHLGPLHLPQFSLPASDVIAADEQCLEVGRELGEQSFVLESLDEALAGSQHHPDSLGYGKQFEAIICAWRRGSPR